MIGFRYHVATICGMLLMFGIGFLLGTTSSIGPGIVKRQTATIQSLSTKLDNVLAESQRDHDLLRINEDAIGQLAPGLVAGKLAGKRIAIVRVGDYPAAAQSAATAITAAGGTVGSITVITNRIQILSDDQRQQLIAASSDSSMRGPAADIISILHPLTAALRVGTGSRSDLQSGLSTLASSGIIDVSGDYSEPVSGVVVVGGWQDDPSAATDSSDQSGQDEPTSGAVEGALLTALAGMPGSLAGGRALTVVGCEPSDAAFSSTHAFSAAGIASIDCIDLPLGALDLPFALRGEQAAYGVKSTATKQIPASLESR